VVGDPPELQAARARVKEVRERQARAFHSHRFLLLKKRKPQVEGPHPGNNSIEQWFPPPRCKITKPLTTTCALKSASPTQPRLL